jgi:hypothetical protein
VALPRLDETVASPSRFDLPDNTPETRAIQSRAEARHLALMADNQVLRDRYEEVMRWVNPPWDPISRRVDPRIEEATAERGGVSKLHVDHTNQVVDRWAVLTAGAPFVFRCQPPYVPAPVANPDKPEEAATDRKMYDIDRAIAQDLATRMENQTQIWIEANDLDRTMMWMAWAKEAFGKAIVRTGWDQDEGIPTAELMENPSTVFYGWSRRYGRRQLAWVAVVDEVDASEANRRYHLNLPLDDNGALDVSSWTGSLDQGDMDVRSEQNAAVNRFITIMEYHELITNRKGDGKTEALQALIIGGRVVEMEYYPWKRLPFHIFENQHIPTYMHGKSVAESEIPINEALDDLIARQHEVVEFESGPRYVGLNMANSGDDVDVPGPFELLPLREGEDIRQLDTRVDFFPSELHSNQLYEGSHRATGLTPIAWGMSPNAQTSGRAMSAEWRAVELPLTGRLVNMGPEVKAMMECWWDYAETYSAEARRLSSYKGRASYRRFKILWIPIDIRDKTEKTLDIIQRLQANILDPETAIEESGYENGDEIMAKIKAYLVDPVYNPLRYQQYLTLQQLELQIEQQQLQNAQMKAQAGQQPGGPPPEGPPTGDLAAQGANAAGQAAQGPGGPVSEANNQAGTVPGGGGQGGGIPIDTSILSQTPLAGGIGNRAIVPLGGAGAPAPTSGQQPQ